MEHYIDLPFTEQIISEIHCGDVLYLSGTIYTARDAAHKRMTEELAEGKSVPFDIRNAVVYYLGPTPARPGQVIGSAGPTTSGRMDKYTPELLDLGLKGMIGKGRRSDAVRESIKKNKAIYMGATGGAGALLSKCIKEASVVAYDDLGTEAVRKLRVEKFPVTVLIDAQGRVFREDN